MRSVTINEALGFLNRIKARLEDSNENLEGAIAEINILSKLLGDSYELGDKIAGLIDSGKLYDSSLSYELINSKDYKSDDFKLWAKNLLTAILEYEEKFRASYMACNRAIVGLNEVGKMKGEAIQVCESYQNNRKKFIWYKIILVALVLVAAVFTVLSCFEPFTGWADYVAAAIGLSDFALGIVFQIYERRDDLEQQTKVKGLKTKIDEKSKDIDISVVQNAEKIVNITIESGSVVHQHIILND